MNIEPQLLKGKLGRSVEGMFELGEKCLIILVCDCAL